MPPSKAMRDADAEAETESQEATEADHETAALEGDDVAADDPQT